MGRPLRGRPFEPRSIDRRPGPGARAVNDFHQWTAWSPVGGPRPRAAARLRPARADGVGSRTTPGPATARPAPGCDGASPRPPPTDRASSSRSCSRCEGHQRRSTFVAGPGRRRHRRHLADERRADGPDAACSARSCRWTSWSARTSRRASPASRPSPRPTGLTHGRRIRSRRDAPRRRGRRPAHSGDSAVRSAHDRPRPTSSPAPATSPTASRRPPRAACCAPSAWVTTTS